MSELKQLLLKEKSQLEYRLSLIDNLLKFYPNGEVENIKQKIDTEQLLNKTETNIYTNQLNKKIDGLKKERVFEPRICKCGKEFIPNSSNQKYCSVKCGLKPKPKKKKQKQLIIPEQIKRSITQEQIERSKSKAYKEYR